MRTMDFPLQCQCSHRSERFQLAFARKAAQIVPQDRELSLQPTAQGLKLLAETELALQRPIQVLREVYGDDVHIEPPSVRYQQGEPVREPYMGLRVLCSPEHFQPLHRDLLARDAHIIDSEVNSRFGVVRATAPLVRLVGYPSRVSELTEGRGKLVMWLSHYAPIQPAPSGGDAA